MPGTRHGADFSHAANLKPMIPMKYRFLLLASTSTGLASAATIVQTRNFAFVPDGSRVLTFDKFDTTLGTLTSVTLSVSATKTGGTYSVDNDSELAGTINLTHSVVGQLSSMDVSLKKVGVTATGYVGQTGNITATNTLSTTVGASSGDSTTDFNATGQSDYVTYSPSNNTVTDSGTIHSGFQNDYAAIGLETFAITYAGTQTVSSSGLSGLQQAFTVANVSGDVTVTYTYTTIPETSTALLGGLGALVLLRRRR